VVGGGLGRSSAGSFDGDVSLRRIVEQGVSSLEDQQLRNMYYI
jgi:hypothetical protein